MYLEILDNAWSFWLVLRQINVQLLLSMVEPLTFIETGSEGENEQMVF